MAGIEKRAFRLDGGAAHVGRDVDAELATHFEHCVEDLVRRGMDPAAARAEATRRFGDVEGTRRQLERLDRERVREERRTEWWTAVAQDVRFALRSLRRQPGFTAAVVLTLALGIGANAAIFSVLDGVLLRPLPYPGADRIVALWTRNDVQQWPRDVSSYPNVADWRAGATTFEAIAAYTGTSPTLTGDGEPERLTGLRSTPSLFRVFGVAPARGRGLVDEDQTASRRVVVLSDAFWKTRFGAAEDVVGRTLRLNGEPHEVVGVMPPGFAFPNDDVAVWLSFAADVAETPRGQFWLEAVGRMKPGVAPERAHEDLEAVAARLRTEYARSNEGLGVTMVSLHEAVVGDVRPTLLVLMGAVGFVLLIACANVANLLLVRGAGRARELAVRAALGAGRRRIVQQLVVESGLLALAGAALGLLLAVAGVRLLLRLAPATIPRLDGVTVNGTVLLFTLGVAVATALLFGLPYGIRAGAMRLASTLKDGQRGSGTEGMRARRALVVSQLALTLAILAAAGLLLTTVRRLQTMDAGLDPRGVLSAQVAMPASRYEALDKRRAFRDELLARVRALPGVTGAAATSNLPLSGSEAGGPIRVVGEADRPGLDEKEVRFTRATPDYFATLRMPMRRGRAFAPEELGTDSTGMAVINATLARLYFGDRDPVGRQISPGSQPGQGPSFTVVGVVADARQSLLDAPIRPEFFISAARNPGGSFSLVVRTDGDPAALAAPIRAVVRELDPELALANVQPLEQYWATSIAARRFNALLLGIFALVALALAVVGIYGVMAYAVAARQREVGIRLAVGAQPGQVVRLVLRDALGMTALGLALGLALTLGVSRLLGALLFDVSPTDPILLGAATLLLGLVGLMAGLIPSRRAAGVDPLVALRAE